MELLKNTKKEIKKFEMMQKENASTDIHKIKMILQKNNIYYMLYSEFVNKFCEIWNKYTGKQFGDATQKKIKTEIENTFNNDIFVYVTNSKIMINWRDDTKKYNDWRLDTITIVAKHYDDAMLKDNKIQQINKNQLYLCGCQKYIKDIDATVTKLLKTHAKAIKLQNDLHKLYYVFSDLTDNKIQPISYEYIVKSWIL